MGFTLKDQVTEHILHTLNKTAAWVKPAFDAVEAMNDGETDAEIDAPYGYKWPNGKEYMKAASVCRLFSLDQFVKEKFNDDSLYDDEGLDDFEDLV
jgi:hypothetical protein